MKDRLLELDVAAARAYVADSRCWTMAGIFRRRAINCSPSLCAVGVKSAAQGAGRSRSAKYACVLSLDGRSAEYVRLNQGPCKVRGRIALLAVLPHVRAYVPDRAVAAVGRSDVADRSRAAALSARRRTSWSRGASQLARVMAVYRDPNVECTPPTSSCGRVQVVVVTCRLHLSPGVRSASVWYQNLSRLSGSPRPPPQFGGTDCTGCRIPQ